jgi:KaiC/GvpD/RAD55 family RecA-like ATPase
LDISGVDGFITYCSVSWPLIFLTTGLSASFFVRVYERPGTGYTLLSPFFLAFSTNW